MNQSRLRPPALSPASPLHGFWAFWIEQLPFSEGYARGLGSRCGTPADDLLDEALVRALTATLRGTGPERPNRSWLKTLIDRIAVDHHRRRQRFRPIEDGAVGAIEPNPGPTPERELILREERERLGRQLQDMPSAWRRSLELRAIDGYSYEKIAHKLRITSSNARKRVQLAREALRQAPQSDRTLFDTESSRGGARSLCGSVAS
jgi:RNA polymerase sigma factor (sigma-70 family)